MEGPWTCVQTRARFYSVQCLLAWAGSRAVGRKSGSYLLDVDLLDDRHRAGLDGRLLDDDLLLP